MTTTYALLLRGINVGGHRRVPMPELRALLTELGHSGVTTYLQSGNAVLTATSDDEKEVAAEIERAVEKHFGFAVDCLVRSGAYLRAVADACPFPAAELEGKQLHVTFYDEPVTEDRFAPVDPAAHLPEEFRLGDRALYLYAPDGLGRSDLAAALARPAVTKGLVATSRNWNTVAKLVELTRD
ncbi:DUF1697 domain-containing protein [Streptomyces sp. NBC_01335]|uniref:DUF1697 domain-containing protein n=1 Tax=Streptomyces sp. NBC_01335 TaxID=2903828 RepID=UPI002E140D23|nr:DUF1697 domain-containing protein [Streptomyces sp. NBC_01335]